jgi:pimeloyl-ACP methyl ester carboxylesterase
LDIQPDQLKIGTATLEAAWYGPSPEDAPTLVFLHEGLGCVAMWREFPAKLSDATGCGAFLYSRSGYGRSDPCPVPRSVRFMYEEALQVLPEIIKKAGIREHILIGHSDGGSIGIVYSGSSPPSSLLGIVTEAAHVFCEDLTLKSIRKVKRAYLTGDLRRRLKKYHGSNIECAFRGWNDVWLHPDFAHWNIEEYLPGIKVPMLAIQGENDEYGTKAQVEAIRRQTGATAEVLMLPECGHAPHRHQEKRTLDAMKQFVLKILDLHHKGWIKSNNTA